MHFWRAILASLLSLICTLSVSAFVTLATLQTTILDRTEVKGWLSNSGVYQNLLNNVIQTDQTIQQKTASAGLAQNTLQTALSQTFTPAYVQQSTEKMLDGTYDWLDGKQPAISFEINTTEKKEAFVANVATILKPQLAQMPRCSSALQFDPQNPSCIPPGTSVDQLAQSLATDAGNQLAILQQPLTDETLNQANASNQAPTSNATTRSLPNITANLRQWLIWLPMIAIVSGGLMVLLSSNKLKAGKHLAGRLTIGLATTFIIGLIVAIFGKSFKLGDYITGANSTVMKNIIEPLLHQAAPAIGTRLAIVSGITGALTLAMWITLRILNQRAAHTKLLAQTGEAAPSATDQSPETHTKPKPPTKAS